MNMHALSQTKTGETSMIQEILLNPNISGPILLLAIAITVKLLPLKSETKGLCAFVLIAAAFIGWYIFA